MSVCVSPLFFEPCKTWPKVLVTGIFNLLLGMMRISSVVPSKWDFHDEETHSR
jgi:hypothetical protein